MIFENLYASFISMLCDVICAYMHPAHGFYGVRFEVVKLGMDPVDMTEATSQYAMFRYMSCTRWAGSHVT